MNGPKLKQLRLERAVTKARPWFLGQKYLRKGLEEFKKVYNAALEKVERIYERAARGLFGGIEKMQKLQCVPITWFQ